MFGLSLDGFGFSVCHYATTSPREEATTATQLLVPNSLV